MPFAFNIPRPGADGWPVATPESVGLDSAVLSGLNERLASCAEANIHSVLLVRRGALVYERYFVGADQCWGGELGPVEFHPETKHDLRSVTKSVTALLVGIAIGRKLIGGIDAPLFDYFPEYADLRTPAKGRIALRHLLTMSAGLEWDQYPPFADPANSETRMFGSRDPYRFVLEQPVVAAPGKVFEYSSGASELLGAVLRKVAGRPVEDFAREVLFEPLGVTDTAWSRFPNSDVVSACGGLRLRPRDMAKLGQLLLTRGDWHGRQVVPSEWITDSIAPQVGDPGSPFFYGYQWWLGRSLLDKGEVTWAAGIGHGGQRIFVAPALDLVVVMTAGLYSSPLQFWVPMHLLNLYVLAAIQD